MEPPRDDSRQTPGCVSTQAVGHKPLLVHQSFTRLRFRLPISYATQDATQGFLLPSLLFRWLQYNGCMSRDNPVEFGIQGRRPVSAVVGILGGPLDHPFGLFRRSE